MLLRPTCACCGAPGASVCVRCRAALPRAPSLPLPAGVGACVALYEYGAARPLVTSLKNGDRRDLVAWLADRLASTWTPPFGAVVTWAPTGAARRRRRGFDQAELLARAVARRWAVPCAPLLRRMPGPAQAGQAGRDRRANPRFVARAEVPRRVVVVDDVATTGATLAAAAAALRAAGAAQVDALVAARARPGRAA
jgi:predicted amidophosphoribosyltransferase